MEGENKVIKKYMYLFVILFFFFISDFLFSNEKFYICKYGFVDLIEGENIKEYVIDKNFRFAERGYVYCVEKDDNPKEFFEIFIYDRKSGRILGTFYISDINFDMNHCDEFLNFTNCLFAYDKLEDSQKKLLYKEPYRLGKILVDKTIEDNEYIFNKDEFDIDENGVFYISKTIRCSDYVIFSKFTFISNESKKFKKVIMGGAFLPEIKKTAMFYFLIPDAIDKTEEIVAQYLPGYALDFE